jgi:hypothetical protein
VNPYLSGVIAVVLSVGGLASAYLTIFHAVADAVRITDREREERNK